ncbi:MAG: DUF2442 domain-containing protein [Syntrophobacteraceae bacterium]
MYPSIKEVTPRDDFTLFFVFENGENGVLDMKPMLDFGVFQRIKDLDKFKRVRIAFDTIEWDCGVDLDPEYIYAKCKEGSTAEAF